MRKKRGGAGWGDYPGPALGRRLSSWVQWVVTKARVIGYTGYTRNPAFCPWMTDPQALVSYFEAAVDALASVVPSDDFAAASSTTIVIFIPPWPNPQ